MVDMYHNQKEATGTGSAQKLPSFAIFLSLSTPDETEPVTEYERVSPNTTGTLAPSSNMSRYSEIPSLTSAGDKFRNWFPETRANWEHGRVLSDPWSGKPSASTLSQDPNCAKLRSALLESQAEQGGQPRRTSLPSISSLTSPESHDADQHHNPWRRARSLPPSSLARSARKKRNRENGEKWPSSGAESDRQMYKCPFEGCGQLYTWKENLTRHHTTRHVLTLTPRRCPFCKVNAERQSFNRIDNFKEHIRRHTNERDNGRTRTEYHPAAAEYYRQLMEETRGERRRVKGRGRRMSPRSDASDDSASDGVLGG
ncbi:hypothetical protein VUR80DRAFT_10283 [Thermomyces stellatus]